MIPADTPATNLFIPCLTLLAPPYLQIVHPIYISNITKVHKNCTAKSKPTAKLPAGMNRKTRNHLGFEVFVAAEGDGLVHGVNFNSGCSIWCWQ
jgi:hypothetical protein